YNPAFTQRFNAFINNFMTKGYSYLDSKIMATKAIEGTVIKQSLLLTYSDAYWVAGMVMLCSIPLLYLQKFKKNVEIPADVH
ncbi:MAG: MFS transporter, partial [Pedobacter sp.]|nr:MFS transporter [Pedobacter sp.]